jgi:hypothetical protein
MLMWSSGPPFPGHRAPNAVGIPAIPKVEAGVGTGWPTGEPEPSTIEAEMREPRSPLYRAQFCAPIGVEKLRP